MGDTPEVPGPGSSSRQETCLRVEHLRLCSDGHLWTLLHMLTHKHSLVLQETGHRSCRVGYGWGSDSRALWPCGQGLHLCSQDWETAGVRGKCLSLLDLIPRLFLLAVDFITEFVFILH